MGEFAPDLTAQEKRFVLLLCSGMTQKAAALGAGYAAMSYDTLLARPAIRAAIDDFRAKIQEHVAFGVVEAHHMLMEAWSTAASSTEQRLVVESLMKLHKLGGEAEKRGAKSVTININKLDQLSDEKLLQLAGKASDYLDLDDDAPE